MSEAKKDESDLSGLLCVGDTVITETCFGKNTFVITRVTKTLAKSKRADGYEHTFKRFISRSMQHPYQPYNLTKYSVVKADT